MALIETSLAVLGGVSGVATLHSWVTGIKTGKQIEEILSEQKATKDKIIKITENIYTQPTITDIKVLEDTTAYRQISPSEDIIREVLIPLQSSLNNTIISSAFNNPSTIINNSFSINPWDLLINITPISYCKENNDNEYIPIIFNNTDGYFIGWQKKSVLPLIMGIEYRRSTIVDHNYSEDNHQILSNFNRFIAPTYPDYPEKVEKLQRWLDRNLIVHPSKSDTLIHDLVFIIKKDFHIDTDFINNITIDLIYKSMDVYKNKSWREIAGYLPWTIQNFLVSLNNKEFMNLGVEIYYYINTFGVPKSKF